MRLEEVRRLEFFVRTQRPTAALPHPTYGIPSLRTTPRPVPFWQLAQPGILTEGPLFQSSDTWLGSIVASFLASTSICKQDQNQSLLCPSPLNFSEHTWSRSPGKSNRTVLGWGAGSKPQAVGQALPCNHSCRTISIRYLAWWTFKIWLWVFK